MTRKCNKPTNQRTHLQNLLPKSREITKTKFPKHNNCEQMEQSTIKNCGGPQSEDIRKKTGQALETA